LNDGDFFDNCDRVDDCDDRDDGDDLRSWQCAGRGGVEKGGLQTEKRPNRLPKL
jgi:hypothetical protein